MIEIADGITIGAGELVFKASRSSGPGGQNVNKVNTRITLLFDVAGCSGLSDVQKQTVLSRLSTRADTKGIIRVVSQKYRTQKANRRAAVEKLARLLDEALRRRPIRKKTRIPRAAAERRLREKKRRSLLKKERAKRNRPDFAD